MILASRSASSIHFRVFWSSERLPWLVRSPAWMSTSPGGSRNELGTVALCVSEMQTKRVLRMRGGACGMGFGGDADSRVPWDGRDSVMLEHGEMWIEIEWSSLPVENDEGVVALPCSLTVWIGESGMQLL